MDRRKKKTTARLPSTLGELADLSAKDRREAQLVCIERLIKQTSVRAFTYPNAARRKKLLKELTQLGESYRRISSES